VAGVHGYNRGGVEWMVTGGDIGALGFVQKTPTYAQSRPIWFQKPN
jgi:hypothetical protein